MANENPFLFTIHPGATETMFLGYTLAEGLVRVLNVAKAQRGQIKKIGKRFPTNLPTRKNIHDLLGLVFLFFFGFFLDSKIRKTKQTVI